MKTVFSIKIKIDEYESAMEALKEIGYLEY